MRELLTLAPFCLHEGKCGTAEEESATLWAERFFFVTKGTIAGVTCTCLFDSFQPPAIAFF